MQNNDNEKFKVNCKGLIEIQIQIIKKIITLIDRLVDCIVDIVKIQSMLSHQQIKINIKA